MSMVDKTCSLPAFVLVAMIDVSHRVASGSAASVFSNEVLPG